MIKGRVFVIVRFCGDLPDSFVLVLVSKSCLHVCELQACLYLVNSSFTCMLMILDFAIVLFYC